MRIADVWRPFDPEDVTRRIRASRSVRTFALKVNRRLLPNEGFWNPFFMRMLTWPEREIQAGRWTGFDGLPHVIVYPGAPSERIEIGAFSSFAKDVTFMISGNHDVKRVTTWPALSAWGVEMHATSGEVSGRGSIVIGNDVWVGRGATILSGAVIGDGAVVGAYSVVSGIVEPYAIVVGNPAREIRKRFDAATIGRLRASAWWDLPDEVLKGCVRLLTSRDIDGFLAHIEGVRQAGEEGRGLA